MISLYGVGFSIVEYGPDFAGSLRASAGCADPRGAAIANPAAAAACSSSRRRIHTARGVISDGAMSRGALQG
ncbi:MAG: hypothetical protein BroJett031_05880 [Betaproteobacteria bacterium]|nr:MAG: hypothetical protein BroJett031_05880 [Betaproteobacteria bacterium]